MRDSSVTNPYGSAEKLCNNLFKEYGLHFEMRHRYDPNFGVEYKIYEIPFEGRAKMISSGIGPGPAMEYLAYHYTGPKADKVKMVYQRFRNSTV